jgi:hypothetical protein
MAKVRTAAYGVATGLKLPSDCRAHSFPGQVVEARFDREYQGTLIAPPPSQQRYIVNVRRKTSVIRTLFCCGSLVLKLLCAGLAGLLEVLSVRVDGNKKLALRHV